MVPRSEGTPDWRAELIERPRLVRMLEQGLERPLTLVSAPAGAGKSVLLSQWSETGSAPGPRAWLALGREAVDRRSFWAGALAAAARVRPELSRLAVPPHGPLDGFVGAFLDGLSGWPEPLVLVVDDLQRVRSVEALADLDWLVDHPGGSLRLVLATRRDPALRLERLRLAGLPELRAAELAFTLEEAAELLAPFELSDVELEALWRRTEGWAAGVRLAAQSMGRASDDRALVDYVVSEVIDRQPPERLDFMLRTSVAERLNDELAAALGGGDEGTLHELERRDGLARRVPGAPGWYRYHPLLAEVLRLESRRRLESEQAELHRAAGRWHAAAGDTLEALRHAVEGGDWTLAAEVLGEGWLELVTRGSGEAVRELLERIPPEVVTGDAELALALAGLVLEAGDEARADELIAAAQRLAGDLPPARMRRFAVTSTAIVLQRARQRADVGHATAAARAVLDEHWDPGLAVEIRAHTLANLGIAELWAGEWEAADDHLQQAAGLALEGGNDFVLFLAEAGGAAVKALSGRTNDARVRARTAVVLAERRGWAELPPAALALCALAAVHLWRNDRAAAEPLVERAAAALAGGGEPLVAVAVAYMRAWLRGLEGEPLGALDLLRGATAHGPLPPFLRLAIGLQEAELQLALGEPDRARLRLAEEDAPDARVGLARVELAAGDPNAALREVAGFFGGGRVGVLPFSEVEAWTADAIARDALHDEEGALRSLERALDLAEPRGYASSVSRHGAPTRALLRRLVAAGTRHRALAGELLAVLDEGSASERPAVAPLLEPLSERELTVLRFLPTTMSNAEIAAEMYVSVNTVKTHLKHVYRKLDVSDRRDCVQRGRELRLLAPGLGDR